MTVIVSGGAGFIGVNLIEELLKKDKNIFVLDNLSRGSLDLLEYKELKKKINFQVCDLSDLNSTKTIIKQIVNFSKDDISIWHLAANSDIVSGTENPEIDFRDTFLTTYNLLLLCKKNKIRKFYFASSSAVYGDHGTRPITEDLGPLMPISNYGAMKLASEAICFSAYESWLDDLRIFRFPNVVGTPATHGVIIDFIEKLKNSPNRLSVLGNGSQEKSYLHVKDLVAGLLFLSNKKLVKNDNPIFNLGPNEDSIKIKEIAEEVIKLVSPKAEIKFGNEDRGWVGDVPKFKYDCNKALNYGWTPNMNSREAVILSINEIYSQSLNLNF